MIILKNTFLLFSSITLIFIITPWILPGFSYGNDVGKSLLFSQQSESSLRIATKKFSSHSLPETGIALKKSNNLTEKTPAVLAGPDQLVDERVKVFLDASNSWPLDISKTKVSWKQLEGPSVQLSNSEEVRPFFTSPEVGPEGTALVFELTLETDSGISVTDTCIVNVSWGNIQPSADAGADQTAHQGDKVYLDGSGSLDADGEREELKYKWVQTSGPRVVLSDPAACKPFFIAPFTLHPVETLSFELLTTDKGGLKGSDSIWVNISSGNSVLAADAGPDGIFDEGTRIPLEGSNSFVQQEKIEKYFWTQLQGPPVTLSDPTSSHPTFLSPPVKSFETVNLVFELTITSESGLKSSKKTRVRVDDNWLKPFTNEAVIVPLKNQAIGFEVERGGQIVDLSRSTQSGPATGQPPKIPYGLFDLQIRTYEPGGEAKLKVFLPKPAPPGYHWLKCGKNTGWSAEPIPAVFNAERTVFTITLKDGGPCDEDGSQNGIIMDPSGLGGPIFSVQGGSEKNYAANNLSGNKAAFNFMKVVKFIFEGFGATPAVDESLNPGVKAPPGSSTEWSWISLQFGPAFPIVIFTILGFISVLLLKKAFSTLMTKKDEQ
jgi:K319L-like, PKD domain